jgi:SSS family transporter
MLGIIAAYFLVLLAISRYTSRGASNATFFTADKSSPWFLVAFGMIGASLSGVTFISVPGTVGAGGKDMAFSYMQMVYGYMLGYLVIATVLLPLYYRLKLVSIYEYLGQRFGPVSYKIGAFYFLLSRTLGASLRLLLVAIVLQQFVLGPLGLPMPLTVAVTIALIWVYTFSGGIKTIVITDTLQTVFMLLSVVLTIVFIAQRMEISGIGDLISTVQEGPYSQMFFFDGGWSDANNFWKQFISGALITIVMTGLDQDMMQKNLTCRSLKDAQKNMATFSVILIIANLLFVGLGALLYMYADTMSIAIPERSDLLHPTIALDHLPPMVGVIFILGLIAAAYSSADSALTSLTTSFCVDFLGFNKAGSQQPESAKRRTRIYVHIGFSVLLCLIIVGFDAVNKAAVLGNLFTLAGYTYGPLLGLYSFGLFTKRTIQDRYALLVCLLAPMVSYMINTQSADWLGGFTFGHTIIALNGLLTFVGLWMISHRKIDE